MIRLVFLLRRNPELTLSEFHESWRHELGPIVVAHQTRLGILRYTQTHRLEDPTTEVIVGPRGQMEQPYDGVAEVWWASLEALTEALQSAGGKHATGKILAAEEKLIDLPNSPLWVAQEYPQWSVTVDRVVARPSGRLVKSHFVLRHRSELTMEQAQRYWLTKHGPLGQTMAPIFNMLSYQQVHRIETPLEAKLRTSRGVLVDPYMGHAEMWWDSSISRSGPEAETLRQQAFEDESRFIDFSQSGMWIGKEHLLVDRL